MPSKQLVFRESFEECLSSESSLSMITVHAEPELLEPSDISYCNFACENTDDTILQLSSLSCSTSLIEQPDSTGCNGSSSLIVIEQRDPESDPSTTSIDETRYDTPPHIPKKEELKIEKQGHL